MTRIADGLQAGVVDGDIVQRLRVPLQLLGDGRVILQALLVAGEPVALLQVSEIPVDGLHPLEGRVAALALVFGHAMGGVHFLREFCSTVGERLLPLFLLGQGLFVRGYGVGE